MQRLSPTAKPFAKTKTALQRTLDVQRIIHNWVRPHWGLGANGAKAGIRVIISAQDPDTVYKSPSSAKIFQNLSTRLIGRVQPTAVDSFERILKYPRSIISRNASESFFPKREGIYSQWLLDNNGIYTYFFS